MLDNQKKCSKCQEIKDITLFRFRNEKAISHCKKCEKDYWDARKQETAQRNKIWREQNKEQLSHKASERRYAVRAKKIKVSLGDIETEDGFFDIPDYIGLYKISKAGVVVSCPKVSFSSYRIKKVDLMKGYHRVALYKNGKSKNYFVHQLVALAFLENPLNKPQVNHINGIKTDNNLSNLEWCTPFENIKHSIENNLAGTNKCRKHKTNTSGYIGVHWHKVNKKWNARLRLKSGKRKSIGFFDYVVDAAKAYDEALFEEWGDEYEFNFPKHTI